MIENMIYGSSSDPIELKRIELKVWSLKEEISFALQNRIDKQEDHSKIDISDIKAFYIKSPRDMGEAQKPIEQLDDSEDEMAKAMAEVEAEEKAPAAEETPPAEEKNPVAEGTPPAENAAENDQAAPVTQYERIPNEAQRTSGFCLLADLGMDGILFFSKKTFMPGAAIVIFVDIPHSFTLSAEVIKSFDFESKSKVISETRPGHRIQAKFIFNFPGERTNLRNFLESVLPTKANSKVAQPSEEKTTEPE